MPNFAVGADGTAKATLAAPRVNLGTGDHSLFANGGTAVVIHAKPGDMKSDPADNAGDRITCGGTDFGRFQRESFPLLKRPPVSTRGVVHKVRASAALRRLRMLRAGAGLRI
jgi:hypothetical protein